MRVVVVSHSLIAPRQQLFWDYFSSLPDVQVCQIYPARWQNLSREGGVDVNSYDMFTYHYRKGAWKRLVEFEPDLVYIQEEVYSQSTQQMVDWASRLQLRPKIGVFVWENLREAEVKQHKPEGISFIVAGNKEAARIHGAAHIAPQVGVDFTLFSPDGGPRPSEVVYASRKDVSKGWDLVEKLPYSVRESGGYQYMDLPKLYNHAKVHVVLSQDTPYWKEQFLPYTNVEALACGCSCVGTAVASVREWGEGCPGFTMIPPRTDRNAASMITTVSDAIASQLKDWKVNAEGRHWAKARFSKEAVANTLMRIFKQYAD